MFYSALVAETLRITKTNINADFLFVKPFIFRTIKQGGHNYELSNALKSFFKKYQCYFKDKDAQESFSLIFRKLY